MKNQSDHFYDRTCEKIVQVSSYNQPKTLAPISHLSIPIYYYTDE